MIVATVIASVMSTAAMAESIVYGKVVNVTPDRVSVQIEKPREVCQIREVPVYGQEQMDQNGAIVGGIIGGVIGNQFGKGGGKAAATGIGAITGAIIGGKKDGNVVGYRQVRQCQVEMQYEYGERINGYFLTVEVEGTKVETYTVIEYKVGDKVKVHKSYSF